MREDHGKRETYTSRSTSRKFCKRQEDLKGHESKKEVIKPREIVPERAEPKMNPRSRALQEIRESQATAELLLKRLLSSAMCAKLRREFALISAFSRMQFYDSRRLEKLT